MSVQSTSFRGTPKLNLSLNKNVSTPIQNHLQPPPMANLKSIYSGNAQYARPLLNKSNVRFCGGNQAIIHESLKTLGVSKDLLPQLAEKLKNTATMYDLDGVLYGIDKKHMPFSKAYVNLLTELGSPQGFITNNPRFAPREIVGRLQGLGYNVKAEQLITCGVAGCKKASSECERLGIPKTVSVIGTPGLEEMARDAGLEIVDHTKTTPSVLLVGEKLAGEVPSAEETAKMAHLAEKSKVCIVTNPDETMPHGGKIVDCVGKWGLPHVTEIRKAFGLSEPIVTGKPSPTILEEGVGLLCQNFGKAKEELKNIYFIGDTPNTDMKGATTMGLLHSMHDDTSHIKWSATLVGTGNTELKGGTHHLPVTDLPHSVIRDFKDMPTVVLNQSEEGSAHLKKRGSSQDLTALEKERPTTHPTLTRQRSSSVGDLDKLVKDNNIDLNMLEQLAQKFGCKLVKLDE